MSDWSWQCSIADITHITVAADDEGCLRVEERLYDGREIVSRFRYMEDLAELANDSTFSGQIVFAPGDEGLQAVLETARLRLRGELH
jgi:hypothetical protein